ncbi:MAG: hemerythrin domain-containing protein [Desulfobacterales bacterium]|jgi:hemerythrin-like domain-containing protein|nr:hemerythrin domain-containing protein [Desulfobacterales bacterium]
MKATEELKKEHEGIALMLRVLQTVGDQLKHGESVDTEHLDGILEFLTIFVDKCHHGKEEDFLFPALEVAGVPREGGPIGVMLSEHEQGRKLVARLKDAVIENKSRDKANAANVQRIINEYVALLTQHIAKENTVLFPMADAKLDAKKDTELFEAFEQLERERIGVGKHDEFHALLDRLQNTYLKRSVGNTG